jgi:hypothetical protein
MEFVPHLRKSWRNLDRSPEYIGIKVVGYNPSTGDFTAYGMRARRKPG